MYNFLYEFVKTDVSKKSKRDVKELISSFTTKYSQYLEEKMKKLIDKKNREERKTTINSFLSFKTLVFSRQKMTKKL